MLKCLTSGCKHYGNDKCKGFCSECFNKIKKKLSDEARPTSFGNESTDKLDKLWMRACCGAAEGNKDPLQEYCEAGGSIDRSVTLQESVSLENKLGFLLPVNHTLGQIAESRGNEEIIFFLACVESNKQSEEHAGKQLSAVMDDFRATPSYRQIVGDLSEQALKRLPEDIRCLSKYGLDALGQNINRKRADGLTFLDMRRSPAHSLFLPKEFVMTDAGQRGRALGPLTEAKRYLQSLNRNVGWWPDCSAALMVPVFTSADLNCLLHAISLTLMGVRDSFQVVDAVDGKGRCVLRDAMYTSLIECQRLQEVVRHTACRGGGYQGRLDDVMSEAQKDRSPLDTAHIFTLSNVLRRPIIVHDEPRLDPETQRVAEYRHQFCAPERMGGIYLPLLWRRDDVSTDPLVIAYTDGDPGHFTGLCPVEPSSSRIVAIPLFDVERAPLPVPYAAVASHGDDGWIGWAGAPPPGAEKCGEALSEPRDCTDLLRDYLKLDSDVHGLYAGMRVPDSSSPENSGMVKSDLNNQVVAYTEALRKTFRKKLKENS